MYYYRFPSHRNPNPTSFRWKIKIICFIFSWTNVTYAYLSWKKLHFSRIWIKWKYIFKTLNCIYTFILSATATHNLSLIFHIPTDFSLILSSFIDKINMYRTNRIDLFIDKGVLIEFRFEINALDYRTLHFVIIHFVNPVFM